MSDIKLIRPTMEYAEDIWQFRRAIIALGDKDCFAGCFTMQTCAEPVDWIESIELMSSEDTCPDGTVPSDTFIAVRISDDKMVGVIELRHHIDHPVLGVWGGHVGYSVHPDERRKGYGKEMLRQGLEYCRLRGLDSVLITCDIDNTASERTILANGGVFERQICVDGDQMKRYWITL